ncbi:MAG: RNA polymerase sporulation sigma factor SigH [Firmicutes bacterium]|nr:RNA polymerase sporulation sigma factor SigH [Bacillota bacterium]
MFSAKGGKLANLGRRPNVFPVGCRFTVDGRKRGSILCLCVLFKSGIRGRIRVEDFYNYAYSDELVNMSDEEVVELARQGDNDAQEYLIGKYKNFVRAKARSYFLIGADKEDIIQEGMIGLYKAIRDYRPDKLSSFRAFAELCITRQIITAIKTATRQKHIPLNSYISLNKPIYDEDSDRTLLDVISGTRVTDPEELVISQEDFDDIEAKMGEILSSLEWNVLMYYLEGKSYQDIAAGLDRHVKSIDNALQRVKRKLERYLQARDQENKQV